jgi:hypothetical protein
MRAPWSRQKLGTVKIHAAPNIVLSDELAQAWRLIVVCLHLLDSPLQFAVIFAGRQRSHRAPLIVHHGIVQPRLGQLLRMPVETVRPLTSSASHRRAPPRTANISAKPYLRF